MDATRDSEQPEPIHPFGLSVLFGLLYFIQGVSEPTEGLMSQPVKSLLTSWGNNAEQLAAFMALLSLPWSIKPIYGLVSDFVPLAGYRRKSYLIASGLVTAAALCILYALDLAAGSVDTLFLLLVIPTTAVAFSDVVVDAVMVAKGQPHGLTGRFQSIQWGTIYAAEILTGWLGGYLCAHEMQKLAFLICGLTAIGTLLLAMFAIDERRVSGIRGGFTETVSDLRRAVRSPTILAVGAFIFCWSFNPFSHTLLYVYVEKDLELGEQFYGDMVSVGAVSAMLGSLLYGIYCRRVSRRVLVHVSIVMGILGTVCYANIHDTTTARAAAVAYGFAYATGMMVQLDLAAQVCPPRIAGTMFALLMALSNLGTASSTAFGGWCYQGWLDRWGNPLAFNLLVGIGALFTCGCWFVVPYLKRAFPREEPGETAGR